MANNVSIKKGQFTKYDSISDNGDKNFSNYHFETETDQVLLSETFTTNVDSTEPSSGYAKSDSLTNWLKKYNYFINTTFLHSSEFKAFLTQAKSAGFYLGDNASSGFAVKVQTSADNSKIPYNNDNYIPTTSLLYKVYERAENAYNLASGKSSSWLFESANTLCIGDEKNQRTDFIKNAKIGDNIYIIESDCPDFWISAISDNIPTDVKIIIREESTTNIGYIKAASNGEKLCIYVNEKYVTIVTVETKDKTSYVDVDTYNNFAKSVKKSTASLSIEKGSTAGVSVNSYNPTNGAQTIKFTYTDTNTFRPITLNGNDWLAENKTTALNLISGDNITLSNDDSGNLTISSSYKNTSHYHSAGVGLILKGTGMISGTTEYRLNLLDGETKENDSLADTYTYGAPYTRVLMPIRVDANGKLAAETAYYTHPSVSLTKSTFGVAYSTSDGKFTVSSGSVDGTGHITVLNDETIKNTFPTTNGTLTSKKFVTGQGGYVLGTSDYEPTNNESDITDADTSTYKIPTARAVAKAITTAKAAGVEYKGAITAIPTSVSGLSKGDFYRFSAAVSSINAHIGDIYIYNGGTSTTMSSNFDLIHTESDTDTDTYYSGTVSGSTFTLTKQGSGKGSNITLGAPDGKNSGIIGTGYPTSSLDRNYKLQVDLSGNGYVNVPWKDPVYITSIGVEEGSSKLNIIYSNNKIDTIVAPEASTTKAGLVITKNLINYTDTPTTEYFVPTAGSVNARLNKKADSVTPTAIGSTAFSTSSAYSAVQINSQGLVTTVGQTVVYADSLANVPDSLVVGGIAIIG